MLLAKYPRIKACVNVSGGGTHNPEGTDCGNANNFRASIQGKPGITLVARVCLFKLGF